MHTRISIADLRMDGGTQPRSEISEDIVSEYAEDLRAGADFPPVQVMYDGTHYWLYDGFHRVRAAGRVGREEVGAEVHQGTKEDAQWASLAANKRHGLRRDEKDKRRAIKRALKMRGANTSDRQIARHVGVDNETVGKYRRELESGGEIRQVDERTGADGKTYDTSNIGGSSPTLSVSGKLEGSGEDLVSSSSEPEHTGSSDSDSGDTAKTVHSRRYRIAPSDVEEKHLTKTAHQFYDQLTRVGFTHTKAIKALYAMASVRGNRYVPDMTVSRRNAAKSKARTMIARGEDDKEVSRKTGLSDRTIGRLKDELDEEVEAAPA